MKVRKLYPVICLKLLAIISMVAGVALLNSANIVFAEDNIVTVSNESDFANAIIDADATSPVIIQLIDNITFTANGGLSIGDDADITIDNNGYKISTTNAKYLINEIPVNASLTFRNVEMVDVYDSVIGDNYGKIVFESTAGEGIDIASERIYDPFITLPNGIEVANIEGNIVSRNYGDIEFIDGKYVSEGNDIIENNYAGTVTFDGGYYKAYYAILDAIENSIVTINNGEFITETYYAFDDTINSQITFKNGKITAYEECFYIYDNDSTNNTTLTIENGTFESLENAVLGNYASYNSASVMNIYGGAFLSHQYYTVDNYSGEVNIYGGEFKFVSTDDNDYSVVYNGKNYGSSTAGIINLLGISTFETDAAESLVFTIEGDSILNVAPEYYASPTDFLVAYTDNVQILPRAVAFNLTYLPGASDGSVVNLPATDSGYSTHPYTIPSIEPEREGYVFTGWALNYEVKTHASYKICYFDITNESAQLASCETVPDVEIGSTVTVTNNKEFTDYKLIGDQTVTITINGVDDLNIVNFNFKKNTVPYTVHYVNMDNVDIIDPVTKKGVIGSTVTEYPEDLSGVYNSYGFPYFPYDEYDHIDIDVTEETDGQHYYFKYNTRTTITVKYINVMTGEQVDSQEFNGIVGEPYTATAQTFSGYINLIPSTTIELAENPEVNEIIFLLMSGGGGSIRQ